MRSTKAKDGHLKPSLNPKNLRTIADESASQHHHDTASVLSTNSRSTNAPTYLGEYQGKKVLMKGVHKLTLKRLGILDHRGMPNEQMLVACRVLRINIDELETKTLEDFINKQYEYHYQNGGQ